MVTLFHGSLATNLKGALHSARRLRKQRVYTGTLQHWQNLVNETNRLLAVNEAEDDAEIRKLVVELEAILAKRKVMGGRPG